MVKHCIFPNIYFFFQAKHLKFGKHLSDIPKKKAPRENKTEDRNRSAKEVDIKVIRYKF